jgi:hypothetical protein
VRNYAIFFQRNSDWSRITVSNYYGGATGVPIRDILVGTSSNGVSATHSCLVGYDWLQDWDDNLATTTTTTTTKSPTITTTTTSCNNATTTKSPTTTNATSFSRYIW